MTTPQWVILIATSANAVLSALTLCICIDTYRLARRIKNKLG